jgi:S-formylglutathione hydrolase
MSTSVAKLESYRFFARSTSTEVECNALVPAHIPAAQSLPLVLHLQGAMSSAASLEMARPAYEAAWVAGHLPPAIVACASTPTQGGFYIDYPGGPLCESLVAQELPDYLGNHHLLASRRAVIGFSMGGYGALKIALRRPDAYQAVAALCPTVFPAENLATVPAQNRLAILDELNQAMGAAGYDACSVYGILRSNLIAVRGAKLGMFMDCGELDEYGLFDGARYLDRADGAIRATRVPSDSRRRPR